MTDDLPPRRRRVSAPIDTSNAGGGVFERVKSAKRQSNSSANWLRRQLNDPYVRRAKAEGWRARSAYKLLELDEKFHLLSRGCRVIDLGAAPGGWSQVAVSRGAASVVGVDLLPTDPMPGATFVEADFLVPGVSEQLIALLGGPPDVVLSDMAANTVGHRQTDHLRTAGLAESAVAFALDVLAPGGSFCAKVFQGGAEKALLDALKLGFAEVKHAKPPSSRAESPELFVIAKGFRGR
jgi:23S rRNA (uridine2552-2'-O)-methyltransferase